MAKYYTPDISEFHIGFEYERTDGGDYYKKTCDAYDMMDVKTQVNRKLFFGDPEVGIDNLRVKYLDKEDIESLGLQVMITDYGQDTEEYEDIYHDGHIIGRFYPDDEKTNVKLFENYFIVKNKSELKKLLNQLEIL